MKPIPISMQLVQPGSKRKSASIKRTKAAAADHLHHLAFDNSLQANIISIVSDGRIIKANMAACKLLGYSKKELLSKNREEIFNMTTRSYIKMIKERTAEGNARATVTVIKKNGKELSCEITSVVFTGDHGIEKSITTIVDRSESILKQRRIDTKKHGTEVKLKKSQIADAVTEAHEQERSDIAQELHDNVNQLLGVSRLYIEMARKKGVNEDLYLSRSSEYTLNAIEEIRKLTRGMITDVIKDLGLCEALDHAINDAMEIHPIKIVCTQDSLIEKLVNTKFKLNIFRIVQEQLNNILKHARASVANIHLSQNKKTVTLSITDNGVGFDTTKKTKGIGIANIRNRAKVYKGSAKFVSQPGKGCVLTVTFPVTDALLNKDALPTEENHKPG